MSLSKRRCHVGLLGLVVALTVGCAATPAERTGAATVAASATTRAALGVDQWHVRSENGVTSVEGLDDRGGVLVQFTRTITTTDAGIRRGVITTTMTTEATLRYAEQPDGTVIVLENELPLLPEAVDAARWASGDLEAAIESNGELAGQSMLAPRDLTGGDAPLAGPGDQPTPGLITSTGTIIVAEGKDVTKSVSECGQDDANCPSNLTHP